MNCYGEEVTSETLIDAKRVLIQNQERLVVEEEEQSLQEVEECDTKLTETEKRVLHVLLWGNNCLEEMKELEQNGIFVNLILNQINEKASEKIGDIVINVSGDISIFEEYIEECEQWYYE